MLGGVVGVVVVALGAGVVREEDGSAAFTAAVGCRAVRDVTAEYKNIARRTLHMLEGQPALVFCTEASSGGEPHALHRAPTLLPLALHLLLLLRTNGAEAACGDLEAAVQTGRRINGHHRSDVVSSKPDVCRCILVRCETATA